MTAPLPEKAADTTAEQPWPVRTLSMRISEYVDKMSPLWVEGQIVQLQRRPGAPTCYVTLRDPDVDMSLSVTVHVNTLDAMGPGIGPGARVVVQAKPTFWTKRGSLHLDARQMRPVGVGDLLLRLEHLKQLLRSEGLFDVSRKRPLPFLPRRVGLICGRASAAEKDVVENTRLRWPATQFEIRQVAVQGPGTVEQVGAALAELDAAPDVDVIVIARGGGAFEDLLPFSNEALLRAVSAARTPVVSAIGHDVDTPLLDFVADLRASTPTDAARRVVPDLAEQHAGLDRLLDRAARSLRHHAAIERRHLDQLCAAAALRDPITMVTRRADAVQQLRARSSSVVTRRLDRAHDQVGHLAGQLRALSPWEVLQRGYAVVRTQDGEVVTDVAQVAPSDLLRVTVAQGDFAVRPVTKP
ncbi:exodeoxyribonuclease VII large subunit [Allobranchiibius sp. GilTou73]|uniref:exodeoxyribonuclease VII large subunit n=1 Tax=Allobranchiibius sp. GilTou73 TaxID=2904523 RepID=UPI001F30FB08|nr:exodeoxyribonuclease VII large subunit [Allobranchiibius sp. GilTou73]UIJ36213.1 exodeoxyribonuclease VII large subunit [Allobranchiibius sp. GilTou73]